MIKNKTKKALWTIRGTIVGASRITDIHTKHGKANQCAMLHIQEDANDAGSAQVAVKVSGDLCNYVACTGRRVCVEYIVRVFEFAKNGMKTLGNDVYAVSIKMI